MRNTFVSALVKAASEDPSIWLINADLGFSVLEPFAEQFPDRYLNIGIAEQNMIGVAAGLALSGFKPFVYSIANFPTQRCLEQIRVDVCYHAAPVVVVAVGGGFAYGAQGYTHHAIEDLAVMRALPGMRVAAPADAAQTAAFVQEFAARPGPAYLRLGRGGEPSVDWGDTSKVPTEPTQIVEGEDVALIVTGAIVQQALVAADALKAKGVSARIVVVAQLKPLNEARLLKHIEGVRLVATIEEHSLIGGLRDTIAPLLAMGTSLPRLVAFGVPDGATIGAVLSQTAMLAHCGIDGAQISDTILLELNAGSAP